MQTARDLPQGLRFEENQGQAPEEVRFLVRGEQTLISLQNDQIVVHTPDGAISIVFPGAAARSVLGQDPLTTRVNHFIGQDPDHWVRNAPTFGQVLYEGLWPGVDLVVYGTDEGHLEFDHIVAPGTDPATVRFRIDGAEGRIEEGRLVADTDHGELRLDPPVVYQEGADGQQTIDGEYRIEGNMVGYHLGKHDPAKPLVIDPVLRYASHLGNSGTDHATDVVVRDSSNPSVREVYVSGHTSSSTTFPAGFPSSGQNTHEGANGIGSTVAFVAKHTYHVMTQTTTPEWYAFIGGTAVDRAHAVAVDDDGHVYITGITHSEAFPVVNWIQDVSDNRGVYDGSSRSSSGLTWPDAFATKIHRDGDEVLFSSYLGGRSDDQGHDIAVDSNGNIIVSGQTTYAWIYNIPYPSKNAHQPLHGNMGSLANTYDTFLTKIDISTSPATFGFSTFLGGTGNDHGRAVASDASGIYVGGYTLVPDAFPTSAGAFQTTGSGNTAFVARYDDAGDQIYATLLGGSGRDRVHAVAPAGSGEVWAVGSTESTNFPVCPGACASGSPAAFQAMAGGGLDAFVSRFDPTGSDLTFSSYHGGSSDDVALAAGKDPASGGLLLAGWTHSPDLPLEQELVGTIPGKMSALVARVDPSRGSPLAFSSYHGGTGDQQANGVDGDAYGVIYLAGGTAAGFTTQSPVQANHGGGSSDGFMSVLDKLGPEAWLKASWSSFNEKSDVKTPMPVSALPTLVVPVGSPVDLDASGSLPGDFPLDPGKYEWTVYDGSTVEQTASGGDTPGFSPYQLNTAGFRVVCARVHDELPVSHPDGNDTACIEVAWENRAPEPKDDTFTVLEDSGVNGLRVLDNDVEPDGQDLKIVGVSNIPASIGMLKFDDEKVEFTPAPDLHTLPVHAGSAPTIMVEYTVEDTYEAQTNATVAIEVENVNDDPVAQRDEFWVLPGSTTDLDVLDNDDDPADPPGALTVASKDDPSTGSVDLPSAADRVVFTAPGAFVGTTSFNYTLEDEDGGKDTVTVTVHVEPAGGVLARDDVFNVLEDEVATLDVLTNDVGPEKSPPAVLDAISKPAHGKAKMSNDGLTILYTPDADFFGTDGFTYTLERSGTPSTATVTVTVKPVNDPPRAMDDEFTIQEDSLENAFWVLENDDSAPDDPETLALVRVGGATHGTTGLQGDQVLYTPDADFFGQDSFRYTIADPDGAEATATVTVLVDNLPDAPMAVDDAYEVTAGLPDQMLEVTLNDVDVDGDALSIAEVEWDHAQGDLHIDGDMLKVSPGKAFIGQLQFRYRATDGGLNSDWATVELDIVAPDEPLLVLRVLTAPLCSGDPIDVRAIALQSDRIATQWDWSAGHDAQIIMHTGDILDWSFTANAGEVAVDLAVLLEGDAGSDWASGTWSIDVINCVDPTADFAFTTDGRKVVFEDRSSDPDGHIVDWAWDFGEGILSAETSPTHTYAQGGHHLVRLTVTDQDGNTHTAERVVKVMGAGGGSGGIGGTDGGSSGGTGGSGGSGGSGVDAADTDGSEDTASSAGGSEDSASGQEDRPPVAIASTSENVAAGAAVVLDGSASHDPDGDALTYRWSQVDGPAVALEDTTSAQVTFTAPEAGELRFRLLVEAGEGTDEAEATVMVIREPQEPQADFEFEVGSGVRLKDTSRNAEGATRTWTIDGQQREGTELLLDLPSGEHEVRLFVENEAGRSERMQTVVVPASTPTTAPDPDARELSIDQAPPQEARTSVGGWALVTALGTCVLAAAAWMLRRWRA